jgi:hypothetical protein
MWGKSSSNAKQPRHIPKQRLSADCHTLTRCYRDLADICPPRFFLVSAENKAEVVELADTSSLLIALIYVYKLLILNVISFSSTSYPEASGNGQQLPVTAMTQAAGTKSGTIHRSSRGDITVILNP